LYKPNPRKNQVISYTIRLDVNKFEPTKKQKSVISKLLRYLDGKTQPTAQKKKEKLFTKEQSELCEMLKNSLLLSLKELELESLIDEMNANDFIQILLCRDESKGTFYSSQTFLRNFNFQTFLIS
jgi:arginyl-tRNA--protein-N-Asp/Glu arginylyltransferase